MSVSQVVNLSAVLGTVWHYGQPVVSQLDFCFLRSACVRSVLLFFYLSSFRVLEEMGFDDGRIILDREDETYYTGQFVRGRLEFNLSKVKSFRGEYRPTFACI